MFTHIPLDSFLAALETDGFRLSVRDHARICLVLGMSGDWTVSRLRSVLMTLLARDKEQRMVFLHRFDDFFDAQMDKKTASLRIDIQRVLGELQQFERNSADLSRKTPKKSIPEARKKQPHLPRSSVQRLFSMDTLKHPFAKRIGMSAVLIFLILLLYIFHTPPPRLMLEPPGLRSSDWFSNLMSGKKLPPPELNFGHQFLNSTNERSIILGNSGGAKLSISAIGFTERYSGFSIVHDACTQAPSLSQNEHCEIRIRFVPDMEKKHFAKLRISSNAEDSPHNFLLKGFGTIEKPQLTLKPQILYFPDQALNATNEKNVILSNSGHGKLSISAIDFTEPHSGFSIVRDSCTQTPSILFLRNEHCEIRIRFMPKMEGIIHSADLHIHSNVENSPFILFVKGFGIAEKKQLQPVRHQWGRPRMLMIKSIARSPMTNDEEWQKFVGGGGLLLLLILAYGAYLRHVRKIPKDIAPPWKKDKLRHLSLECLGGKPAPRLDDETLAHLADSTGYFQSEEAGWELDVPASIVASGEKGGIPTPIFHKRKQIRQLIILVDMFAESLAWNSIPYELKTGLSRLGVPLLYGQFRGSPEQFFTEDGRIHYLEDLETTRKGYLLLIFSDAKGLHAQRDRYALEAVARWPMVAWLELRAREFWDESATLPAQYGIPLYPSTKDGLLRVFGHFLSETGGEMDSTIPAAGHGLLLQGNASLSVYLEQLLGDALPLAQKCAMIQPVTLGLIDAVRREFHPTLPAERIERLIAIPETVRTVIGLRFSNPVLTVLRTGFARHDNEACQDRVLRFLLLKIEEIEPVEWDSPAYLAWKWVRERVNLEYKPDQALERLSKLSQTYLGNMIKGDLEFVVLPDFPFPQKRSCSSPYFKRKPLWIWGREKLFRWNAFKKFPLPVFLKMDKSDGIPLRKAPVARDGRQRLGGLAKNVGIPTLEVYPLTQTQWSTLGGLILIFLGVLGASVVEYHAALQPKISFQAETALEKIWAGISHFTMSLESRSRTLAGTASWNPVESVSEAENLSNLVWLAQAGYEYRLRLSDNEWHTKTEVLGLVTEDLKITIGQKTLFWPQEETGYLAVTDGKGNTLYNSMLYLRTSNFTLMADTDRAVELLAGNWQMKVKTVAGVESEWKMLTITAQQEHALAFSLDLTGNFTDKLRIGGNGPEMVWIPAGTFMMGSEKGDSDEIPVHEVGFKNFAMSRYEITFAEYDRFAEDTGRKNPKDRGGWGRDNRPVIYISWGDATAYAEWLSEQAGEYYRLPTETEWEYVARAGTKTEYWWGDEASHEYANYGQERECCRGMAKDKDQWIYTSPVGSFAPNPFGVYDMAGNVWEWTCSEYEAQYAGKEAQCANKNYAKDSGVLGLAMRGGSWFGGGWYQRVANRASRGPNFSDNNLGFRLVRINPVKSNDYN